PAALVVTMGCSAVQTTEQGAVGVGRTQYMSGLVSPQQVEQAAAQSYAETLADAKAKGVLNSDAAAVQRVSTIAKRLVAQVPRFRPDAANWDWQVNVIDSEEVNAWCMPGGRMAVYTGMIDKVQA